MGDGLLQVHIVKGATKAEVQRFYSGSAAQRIISSTAISACVLRFQQSGKRVPDVRRRTRRRQTHTSGSAHPRSQTSIARWLLRPRGVKYNPDTWDGRRFTAGQGVRLLARHVLERTVRIGTSVHPVWDRAAEGRADVPAEAKVKRTIRRARRSVSTECAKNRALVSAYRQRGEANSHMEACSTKSWSSIRAPTATVRGSAHKAALHHQRQNIHEIGQLNFDELHTFLGTIKPTGRGADAGRQVLKEIRGRVGAAPRHRTRLPELQSSLGYALGWRVAADPLVHTDRVRVDGDVYVLDSRASVSIRKTTSR